MNQSRYIQTFPGWRPVLATPSIGRARDGA
jgi:hypothetical protein